jgi:four helix bundle protein
MAFQVEELSLELIEALVPLMPRIKQRDKNLADQLRRAASSIGLNCAEAAFSDPGNRQARLFTAAGSAGETRHALRQAVAWRIVTPRDAEPAAALLKRIVAILWKMTRGKPTLGSGEVRHSRDGPCGDVESTPHEDPEDALRQERRGIAGIAATCHEGAKGLSLR